MLLSPRALAARIDNQLDQANQCFAGNPYVTIHGHTDPKTNNTNPYKIWIDLNFPHYVERNKRPVLIDSQKGICIEFPSDYPDNKPSVITPEIIVSIHSWGERKRLCTHSVYESGTHTLTQEIENIMVLAANCPETIKYDDTTHRMDNYINWTKEGIASGKLPTVQMSVLLPNCVRQPRRRVSAFWERE